MSGFSNLLTPAVLFFALGFLARIIRSDLKFPADLAKAISVYLLIAIGIHGGHALSHADLATAIYSVLWALILGFSLPILGYFVLILSRKIDPLNAAAIAAHYGSVSAGTFLTAVAYLKSADISYENYPVIMLAVMESPAIIVGLLLAAWARRRSPPEDAGSAGEDNSSPLPHLLRDAFTNGSVVLLIGSMLIGSVISQSSHETIKPFMTDIFMGALCLFLLEMGLEAARRIGDFRRIGATLVAFGMIMPLFSAMIGIVIGAFILDFSIGGTMLVAVLAASASYIAVPPAMRLAIPEANPSFYLTLSLGITFPFNVVVGIPLYHHIAEYAVTI